VERAELVELLSPEGLGLLDSLPAWTSTSDVVRTVTDLRRRGYAPGLVAAVLTQSRLRARARLKFGEFADRMLFTEAGLEQATRLRVAALHAGRYARAGLHHVADLGCGIGGDAMAFAAIDLEVTAAEADEVTAAIAAFNLTPFPRVEVVHSRAEDVPLGGIDARDPAEGERRARVWSAPPQVEVEPFQGQRADPLLVVHRTLAAVVTAAATVSSSSGSNTVSTWSGT
jgi:hypothetical protein